jgi:hypothetical protein
VFRPSNRRVIRFNFTFNNRDELHEGVGGLAKAIITMQSARV